MNNQNKLSTTTYVRLSEEEKKELKKIAEYYQMPISNVIRKCIEEKINKCKEKGVI